MSRSKFKELTDKEWAVIAPLLPDKPRGVPRVDDRKVLNGIFHRLREGGFWSSLPKEYGPHTTCYNRFVRWREAGVWEKIFIALSERCADGTWCVDSTSVRVHQQGASAKRWALGRRWRLRRKRVRNGLLAAPEGV